MDLITEKAHEISIRSFFNSFLRDYSYDSRVQLNDHYLTIILNEGAIKLHFKMYSALGNHKYLGQILFENNVITLEACANLIYKNFSNNKSCSDFSQKVVNSIDNIKTILKYNNIKNLDGYLSSEKLLIQGHPFHPYPKAKLGMNASEIEIYSPELFGSFRLVWVKVDKAAIYSVISFEKIQQELSSLIQFDLGQELDKDSLYIPMHPWQWSRINNRDNLSRGISEYSLGKNNFYSLSSMRTVYNEKSSFQLKFSLNITLTNSIRHLQLEETIRGNQMYDVLKPILENRKDLKLSAQFEPFFVCLRNQDDLPLVESIVQFRDNEINDKDENTYLLSSLCENFEPIDRLERRKWFDAFLENVLKPFLRISTEEGILLGAHMQNILVKLEKNIPNGVIYRDFQGTGFSEFGYKKHKQSSNYIYKENGNVLNRNDVNKVYGYYLIVNTVFGTISFLSDSNKEKELQLLADLRTFLISFKNEYTSQEDVDLSFIDYILYSNTIWQKGNMRCCINSINENTVQEPWQIYNKIANPLKTLRPLIHKEGQLYKAANFKKDKISLRVLTENDLEIFYTWHHKDFVKEFWELDVSKEEILDYIKKTKQSSYKLPLILEFNNEPIGYIEAYWAYEDRIAPYCEAKMYDRGIHVLIGEEKYLRTKVVYQALYHATKYLLEDDPKTQTIWGEPRFDNKKILTFAEKLPGWKYLHDFDFPHKRAALLECDKTRFYNEVPHAIL